MIILSFFLFLLILLILFLFHFRWRLETCGEPRNKLNDIFNCRFTLVDNHGVLQVVDKLLMEQCLILELKEKMEAIMICITGNRGCNYSLIKSYKIYVTK